MSSLPFYFDYMASTPIALEAKKAMVDCLDEKFAGNPSSNTHIYAYYANEVIDKAKTDMATYFNTSPKSWTWTSGATEAINLAIQGVAYAYKRRSNRIITFATEHAASLKTCKNLSKNGFEVEVLPVLSNGLIDLNKLEYALKKPCLLISVLHVNNEIGVVQDLASISKLALKYNTLLHVDGAQTAGKAPIDLSNIAINLFSISSHKIYGPKGIGALYIAPNPELKVSPILFGGSQEFGLRPGTLATHQIAGLGKAFALAKQYDQEDIRKIKILHEQIIKTISRFDTVKINGDITAKVPHNINLTFKNHDYTTIKSHLSNFAFSAASACNNQANRPSHVLMAIGHSHQEANNTIRLSLGRYTSDLAVNSLCDELENLLS